MELAKIQNQTAEELAQQERQAQEQLFRLRFQSKLGQTDTTNQLRTLKKDIARIKTISRQRELGIAAAPKKSAATKGKRKAAK